MIGVLGRIFGGSKAAGRLLDSGLQLVDKAFYTDQERSQDEIALRIETAKQVNTWLMTSGGPNLARRFIAIGIFAMWTALWGTSVILDIVSLFIESRVQADLTADVASRARAYAVEISAEFMLVLGYYFAAPQIDKFVGPLADRMAKRGQKDGD